MQSGSVIVKSVVFQLNFQIVLLAFQIIQLAVHTNKNIIISYYLTQNTTSLITNCPLRLSNGVAV